MNNSIYVISPDYSANTMCPMLDPELRQAVTNEELMKFRRGHVEVRTPLKFSIKGTKKADLLRGEDLFFVSESLKSVLETGRFSGYSLAPVELVGSRGSSLKYHLLRVTGKGGNMASQPTDRIVKMRHSEWDGSDFFMFDNARLVLVTDRVKSLVEAKRCKGVEFDAIEMI